MATARHTGRESSLARDLAGAVGWAVFLGAGFALGLALGSIGADVPTDSGFLVAIGAIVAAASFVVRLGMVVARRRRGPRQPARGSAPQRTRIAGTAPYRPRPTRTEPPAEPVPARRERPPAVRPILDPPVGRPAPTVIPAPAKKKPAARKPAAKKQAAPAKKQVAKKPAAPKKQVAKKPAPKKRPPTR